MFIKKYNAKRRIGEFTSIKFLKLFLVLFCITGVATSCNEKAEGLVLVEEEDRPTGEIEPVEFDVTIEEGITLKVGEPVAFRLSGNADLVKFYSGEFKNDYEYHDKDRYREIGVEMSYEHYMFGNNDPHKVNKDHTGVLMYSNDFNGDYNYENVANTDWKVVEGFNAAESLNGFNDNNFREAGTVDVSHLFEEGSPFYLAWYCKINSGTRRTAYRMRNFKVDAVFEDDPSSTSTLYTLPQLDFQWILNPAATNHTDGTDRPSVDDSEIRWIWPTAYSVPSEYIGYAVSGLIELPQYNLGKDWPVIFATKWDDDTMEYLYSYIQAGEYEVVFVASGINNKERQEIVKRITIQVEE